MKGDIRLTALRNKTLFLIGFSLLFLKINTLIADVSFFYLLTNALGMSLLMYETKGKRTLKKFFYALKIGQVINGSLLLLNSSLYFYTGNNLRTIGTRGPGASSPNTGKP